MIVFAQTSSGKVIVERQYKHGIGKVSLTLPAGAVEDSEQPLAVAQRELKEETGYTSKDRRPLAVSSCMVAMVVVRPPYSWHGMC